MIFFQYRGDIQKPERAVPQIIGSNIYYIRIYQQEVRISGQILFFYLHICIDGKKYK